jgi:hypothetical protein
MLRVLGLLLYLGLAGLRRHLPRLTFAEDALLK